MSVSGNRLPFGLKDGRMVEVSEVENGLACGCVCPQCFSPLQANQGPKRSYFSHDPKLRSENCENALETAIHLMAKQLLSEHKFVRLPELVIKETLESRYENIEESEVVEEERDVSLVDVIVEDNNNRAIKPDLSAKVNGEQFFVEIAVTHFVDQVKRDKIRGLGVPTIEINLSKVNRDITKSELFELVINATKGKKWISNPKAKGVRQRLKDKIKNRLGLSGVAIPQTPAPYQPKVKSKKVSKVPATSISRLSSRHRWILCEASRYLFQKTVEEFPLHVPTIECPDCAFHASGALARTGKLPQ